MAIRLTFLGTGTSQGVPVIGCNCQVCSSWNLADKRLRSSLLISVDNKTFVIDAGPDFRQQMLRCGMSNIDGVIITHAHKDHIGGLDDLRAFNFLNHKPVQVWATTDVQQIIRRDFDYAFALVKYPGVPDLSLNTVEKSPFLAAGFEFIPIDVMHHQLPVKGYRFKDIAYITDASFINQESIDLLKGLDLLIINALRLKPHVSHFNLDQALEVIVKVNPKQALLTHISHGLGLHEIVNSQLPYNVSLAFDGLTLSI